MPMLTKFGIKEIVSLFIRLKMDEPGWTDERYEEKRQRKQYGRHQGDAWNHKHSAEVEQNRQR